MTRGSRVTVSGGPSAILAPASSTKMWSETSITAGMSCSTRRMVTPSRRTSRGDAPGRHPGDRPAAVADLARAHRVIAGDQVEEGRLAGAVRADQAADRPLRDGEADIVGGDEAAEALRHVDDLEDRRAHRL